MCSASCLFLVSSSSFRAGVWGWEEEFHHCRFNYELDRPFFFFFWHDGPLSVAFAPPHNRCPFCSVQNLRYIYIAQVRFTIVHLRLISRCTVISFTVTRRFSFTMASNASVPSGVTTGCAWPGRGQSVTELMPFMDFVVHPYTCCSDRHASPHWTFIRRWISMGFTPSLLKRRMTERCSLVHVASRAAIFTLLLCRRVAFLQRIATCRPLFKPWVSLLSTQDNRVVFRIFIALLGFSFYSSL